MIDEDEEFGIDWSERDGFQVRRMRSPMLWGPDSETPLFKRGIAPSRAVTRAAKLVADGALFREVIRDSGVSGRTVTRIRQGLRAEGLSVPNRSKVIGRVAHDLTGKRFTRLVVVSRAPNNIQGLAVWICRCDCDGRHIPVAGTYLRNGDTKSCGCLKAERARAMQLVASKLAAVSRSARRMDDKSRVKAHRVARRKWVASHPIAAKEARRAWWSTNSKRMNARQRTHRAFTSLLLGDSYVRHSIVQGSKLRSSDIPEPLVSLKRVHLETHRAIKEMQK